MANPSNDDMLELDTNVSIQKMLSKIGDNFPENERVVLSLKLIKINKRGKEQDRILLLTDKALYNLKPNELRKCQRRVDLDKMVSITTSTISNEFVVHIPEEYDYRYKSGHKDRIINVISELYKRKEGKKMKIIKLKQASLESVAVTKNIARLQTREQRLQRYRELIGKDSYQDEIDDINTHKITGHLIKTSEKITPNDFEFLKVIGRGSFGKVMQVRKKDTNTIYAMKILKKKALIDKGQVQHTNDERKILQRLQHPFLMHLRYAFQTSSKLYFVLDYYRGGELFFHLKKRRRFTEKEAKLFVAETALALGHLHSLDVIYRDLKPENILLDYSGHICLTDFGLSKDLVNEELSHSFCGTPEYLSPEIVMGLGHGKAADWWFLGILLYELTVGIPPFYSQNVSEMYRKIQEAPLLFPPNLTKHCKDLISRLLIRNPNKRLGSGRNDIEDIKKHPFFGDIDWNKLYRKEIEPPYKPKVKGGDEDVPECFDPIFLNEAVAETPAVGIKGNEFDGWSFKPEMNNLQGLK